MILTYHHIGGNKDENSVSLKAFRRQMRELKRMQYKVVAIKDYDRYNPCQAVITFDDGYADIKNALPVLKKHGYPFEAFIVGKFFGTTGYIGETDIYQIINYGGHLQWHTNSHKELAKLKSDEISQELNIPKDIRRLDPDGFYAFAYPYWKNNNALQKAIKNAGFIYARSGNGYAEGGGYSLDSIKVKEDFDMDKIVKFIDVHLPTFPCNLRCRYCYIGQHLAPNERGKIKEFGYSPQQAAKAFTKKRLGGTCIVNFCASGETLLTPKNMEYIKAIAGEGHIIAVVSNMTITKAIDNLLSLPQEYLQRMFFKCSLHYQELLRLGLLETFADNVNRAYKAGASITVEITPSDEQEPYIEDIKRYCLKHFGALPHITVARDENKAGFEILTKRTREKYEKIWEQFDSDLFKFKLSVFGRKIKEFCYAGKWAYFVNIADGNCCPCVGIGIGNIFKEVPDKPVGKNCSIAHCYNAHAWIGLGLAPEIITPTYAQMRDRVRPDGTHWLYPRIANAFSQKIYNNNKHLTPKEQEKYCAECKKDNRNILMKWLCHLACCFIFKSKNRKHFREKWLK
jgi:peptidoglycan/xylan/chitin deacetylase (PgdA/CDA1 family)